MRASVDISAEAVVGLLLTCWKGLPELLRADRWDAGGKERARLLSGARVLVLGGEASQVAERGRADEVRTLLRPFGVRLLRPFGSSVGSADLDGGIDALVLLPGAPSWSPAGVEALPTGSVAVVASDAGEPTVDLDAVAGALRSGGLAAFGMILGEDDPALPPPDQPLWDMPGALVRVVPAGGRA